MKVMLIVVTNIATADFQFKFLLICSVSVLFYHISETGCARRLLDLNTEVQLVLDISLRRASSFCGRSHSRHVAPIAHKGHRKRIGLHVRLGNVKSLCGC